MVFERKYRFRSFAMGVLVLLSSCPLHAQLDSLKDILPLGVGNKWKYNYSYDETNYSVHYIFSGSGTVNYEVISNTISSNYITWHIKQKRDLTTHSFVSYEWHDAQLKDSTNFDLIEVTSGNHELYTPKFDEFSVFPFQQSKDDSSKFFRFIKMNSGSDVTIRLNFRDPQNPSPDMAYKYSITARANTGILGLSHSRSTIVLSNKDSYQLLEFHKPYPDPYLNLPVNPIQITTLIGLPKDTTITIGNDGIQPLVISNVTTSDPQFSVLDYSTTIGPQSAGNIKLLFNPQAAGMYNVTINIDCNSVGTDNKINVNAKAYDNAIIQIKPSSDFYAINGVNGKTSFAIYTITNLGTMPLIIDSVAMSGSEVFRNTFKKLTVAPGKTDQDTIYFEPKVSGRYDGYILLYNNSPRSPYKIQISGISAGELMVKMDLHKIYFARTSIGSTSDTTVTITNYGSEIVNVNVYKEKEEPYNGILYVFKAGFVGSDNMLQLKPNSSGAIRISFSPIINQEISAIITVSFFRPSVGIENTESIYLYGNLNYYLEQNYPNPFNGSTKIRFNVPTKTLVSLKIYDILGREVKTLVNEEMDAGSYEKMLNAAGLASGVYFYMLRADDFVQTKKLLLVK